MSDDRVKHLEFIQAVISRMAGNSFLVKGWTVTLSAALLVLAARESQPILAIVVLYPALVFWGLDAYFLRQERLFRKLYDAVRLSEQAGAQPVDGFTMDTRAYAGLVNSWARTLWAPTVRWFHGVVVGTVSVVFVILVVLWLTK